MFLFPTCRNEPLTHAYVISGGKKSREEKSRKKSRKYSGKKSRKKSGKKSRKKSRKKSGKKLKGEKKVETEKIERKI